jgi:hypothetical protein
MDFTAAKPLKIAVLIMFAGLAGREARSFSFPYAPTSLEPAEAQGGKGAWVCVDGRRDDRNCNYLKNDPCLVTTIGMPSSLGMAHYIESKGCLGSIRGEYSKFSFQWTDPGAVIFPDSVVRIALTATIEHDQLNPNGDPGWGSIAVLCGDGDKSGMGVPQEIGNVRIGGGTKGDWRRPKTANKTIEWKQRGGWKDARLQIVMVGGAPQTKQTFIFLYEWRDNYSGSAPSSSSAGNATGKNAPVPTPPLSIAPLSGTPQPFDGKSYCQRASKSVPVMGL